MHKMSGISIEQADICEAQALNSLADKAVIFCGAFNAEIVDLRIRGSAADEKAAFAAADFACNRVGIAENCRPRDCLLKLAQSNFNIHARIRGGLFQPAAVLCFL